MSLGKVSWKVRLIILIWLFSGTIASHVLDALVSLIFSFCLPNLLRLLTLESLLLLGPLAPSHLGIGKCLQGKSGRNIWFFFFPPDFLVILSSFF